MAGQFLIQIKTNGTMIGGMKSDMTGEITARMDTILGAALMTGDFTGNANDVIGKRDGSVFGATLTTYRFSLVVKIKEWEYGFDNFGMERHRHLAKFHCIINFFDHRFVLQLNI